jgi:hypothetical protein
VINHQWTILLHKLYAINNGGGKEKSEWMLEWIDVLMGSEDQGGWY